MNISNWIEWTSIFSNMFTIIGVVVVIFGIGSYMIEKKHLNLDTVSRCIDIFRNEFADIKPTDVGHITKYLDFVNEELFYFENGYLPDTIADEWLDGMLDFLPLFDKKGKCINTSHVKHTKTIQDNNLLEPNPRISKAFTFKKNQLNLEKIYHSDKKIRDKERHSLIKEVLYNIKGKKRFRIRFSISYR